MRALQGMPLVIVVLSGPSGVGKTRLADIAVDRFGFDRVVPWTTRAPRNEERLGIDYQFTSRTEFQQGIRDHRFFDWDYLLGNYYGYDIELREAALAAAPIIIPVVARMALRLRQRLDGVVLVFLDGPDEVLDQRVEPRVKSAEELRLRIAHRAEERDHASLFDVVRNDAATMSEAESEGLLRQFLPGGELSPP